MSLHRETFPGSCSRWSPQEADADRDQQTLLGFLPKEGSKIGQRRSCPVTKVSATPWGAPPKVALLSWPEQGKGAWLPYMHVVWLPRQET